MISEAVDIWEVPLDTPYAEHIAKRCLSDEAEQRRADRFLFAQDRRRWAAARWALREILSTYVSRAPERIRFATNPWGKPYLLAGDDDSAPPKFNLTHSGELALVAVSQAELGIDAEHAVRRVDWNTLAPELFSEAELAAIPSPCGDRRTLALFRLWTLKEAYLKARGLGLTLPLRAVEVLPTGPDGTYRVRVTEQWDDGRDWRLHPLLVPEGYAAALACAPSTRQIRRLRWLPSPDRE